MSIQFNNTTDKNGIIQKIEDSLLFNDGDISGNATRMAKFTGAVNSALDEVFSIIFSNSSTWQFDDSNHTAYPFITTDINSGQRDYTFTVDGQGNVILDIYKVMVKGRDGIYREIKPVDQQSPNTENYNVDSLIDGQDRTGVPSRYDKTANGIFLDFVPDYDSEDGLKVFINREGSYFTTSDTTKKAGFSGLFHMYLVLKPAYEYARDKSLKNSEKLKRDLNEITEAIKKHYGIRERDVPKRMTPAYQNNK